MQIDGEESALKIRFRELRYSVETGESEMIGVNTIVQGSGTASKETYSFSAGISSGQASQATKQGTEGDKQGAESSGTGLTQEEEECTYHISHITHIPKDSNVMTNSNRKPQHSPQRNSHARIPHQSHKIIRRQHFHRRQHRLRSKVVSPPSPQH